MKLHILGICGTFMGGLAKIARELGHEVTGCDAHVYPPMSDQLRALGIPLHEGYDAEQLDQYPADLYVVGNAMTRGKPIIEAMLERNLPTSPGRSGSATTSCARSGCSPWPGRTARARPRRCSPGSSRTRG
jgi:UDP-N-acetylmuramate: L-alanyl-gamma-D-glutamyl-meso-diaminopimelate ligase